MPNLRNDRRQIAHLLICWLGLNQFQIFKAAKKAWFSGFQIYRRYDFIVKLNRLIKLTEGFNSNRQKTAPFLVKSGLFRFFGLLSQICHSIEELWFSLWRLTEVVSGAYITRTSRWPQIGSILPNWESVHGNTRLSQPRFSPDFTSDS